MSIIEHLHSASGWIIRSASYAIIQGIRNTWERCDRLGNKPEEPDFVAGLVLDSIPILASSWKSLFTQKDYSFALTGVFCHQTPKVRYVGLTKSSVEIGDLLIVHIHRNQDRSITRNALLLQAKTSHRVRYQISGNEINQLNLYLKWPEFTYTRSGSLNGTQRSVTPKMPHTGAQYLLIDDRTPDDPMSGLLGVPRTYPAGICIPAQILNDDNDLAVELYYFLTLRSGRGFGAYNKNDTDWTGVIWDLLRVSLKKAFNRRNSGLVDIPRTHGDTLDALDGSSMAYYSSLDACVLARNVLGENDANWFYNSFSEVPPENRQPNQMTDEDMPSGISLILLETGIEES